ncbi:hypothetical protein TNCV_977431 [Trichonephila clavipes]|nr:hypothetical protein TNCV_977431 [Trichonephila clavipes]
MLQDYHTSSSRVYFSRPRLFLRRPFFSPVPTFFSPVVARSFSLSRLSFDLLPENLTSLGSGTRSVPPSHIEMYLDIEGKRPGLRESFLIGRSEGVMGCNYGDCFGDIRCDGNFSE